MAPGTSARIADALPEARLIYIVRHPLRRIESAWKQNVHMGRLPPDTFKDALWKYTLLVSGSKYFQTLSAYRQYFSDDQILVVFLEDLAEQPTPVLNQCFEFLGVDPLADRLDRGPPQNDSEDHRFVRPLLKQVRRRERLWETARILLPERAKDWILSLFVSPLPSPDWDEETRKWAVEHVRTDARKTLEYAGKPCDFWTFSHETPE
jgi:hypothetical protein